MNRLAVKIWFAATLMMIGWLVTSWVRTGYTFEVHPLARNLNSFPRKIDDFLGTDIPVDDDVRRVLNADAIVNRSYLGTNGDAIALHISAWIHPESVNSVAPHTPRICYTNTGWTILEERKVIAATPAGKLPLIALLIERDAVRCVVAYWYQMGESTFNTPGEARQIHRELWGQKIWPSTVKIMLQTSSQDLDTALPRIEKFVSSVFEWTKEL